MRGGPDTIGIARLAASLVLACLPLSPALSQTEIERASRLAITTFVDRSNEADPAIVNSALEAWANSVAPDGNYEVNAKIESNRNRWHQSVTAGSHDLYGLFAYQYLDLEDRDLLRPALVTTRKNGSASTFLLLTRHEDKITSIEGLRNKKIIVDVGGVGELPLRWLATRIAPHADLSSEEPFAKIDYVQSASRAFLPVYFHKADACVITRKAFTDATMLNPELVKRLHETFKSKPLLVSMFAFHRDYPLPLTQMITKKALSRGNARINQDLLELVHREQLATFEESQLETLRALDRSYKALLADRSDASSKGEEEER